MMTGTATSTKTDIRKVFENFAADLFMLVRRTRIMDLGWAQNVAHDVVEMASYKCLESVHIQLYDALGRLEKAHRYTVHTDGGLSQQRPGGNDWPPVPGGNFVVIVKYSNLQMAEELKRRKILHCSWGATGCSTDYSGMLPDGSRSYSSNAYGLARESFSIR